MNNKSDNFVFIFFLYLKIRQMKAIEFDCQR